MTATLLDPILHAVIALGLLAAYCVLWSQGHQDSTLLGILAGQLGALGVSQVAQKTAVATGTAAPVVPVQAVEQPPPAQVPPQ